MSLTSGLVTYNFGVQEWPRISSLPSNREFESSRSFNRPVINPYQVTSGALKNGLKATVVENSEFNPNLPQLDGIIKVNKMGKVHIG
jgi:hypothetical protein